MLIIPLLAVSFLTQVAVLAAPIPLNGVSLNARGRASSLNDVLFSRSGQGEPPVPPVPSVPSGTFAWIISQHFDSIECLGSTNQQQEPQRRGGVKRRLSGTFAWMIHGNLTQPWSILLSTHGKPLIYLAKFPFCF